ncbi:MAG TPA: helix-turn-helix domain-containing protein, partial [Nevskiaceae bacterium]|nr:helix-turn-helix domain-containing protein [Nevskiaceae bacterium]
VDHVPETKELLARAAERFGSQRAVAEFLGISEGQISNLMSGRRHLRAAQAARLAESMGEPWLKYVVPLLAEKSPNEEDREYWLGKARALGRAAVVLLGASLASLAPVHSPQAYDLLANFAHNIQCV